MRKITVFFLSVLLAKQQALWRMAWKVISVQPRSAAIIKDGLVKCCLCCEW